MVTERLGSGILRFPDAIQKVPERDFDLVDAYIKVLEPVHAFYLAQKAIGFYGGLPAMAVLPKDGNSPYTIVRQVYPGEYRADRYSAINQFSRLLRQIATRMEDVVTVAQQINDPEKSFIEDILRPQAQALRNGDFERATISSLNTRKTPRYPFYVGLLDRYLDPDRGIKLAMQGWLQLRDDVQHEHLNAIADQILKEQGQNMRLRVFAGEMLAVAGMGVDHPWSGNTVPSEDSIRSQVGADAFVFINNMNLRVKDTLIPAARRYLPQVSQIPGWEESMPRATYIGITGHESGHAQIPFDEQTPALLGERYMAIKELMSEVSGLTGVAKLPRNLISPSLRQLIIARSIVQWRSFIDEYLEETDRDKKTILLPYALAGEWMLNTQEREGGIKVNPDSTMEVENWGRIVQIDEMLNQELDIMLSHERYQKGFVDRFIRFNSRFPRSYFPHNPHQEKAAVNNNRDTNPILLQQKIS